MLFGNGIIRHDHIISIDPADGSVKWRFRVPTQIFSTPAVADGVMYLRTISHIMALGGE